MSLTIPQHSKGAVRRAGDYFSLVDDDYFEPYVYLIHHAVLSNWRASHAYPMQSMLGYFRKKAREIDRHSIIAQRLKRAPSIIAKLVREDAMRLDRMEDIGGCRIVVNNLADVYSVRNSIVKGRTRNILRRERDYIKEPKESGYRGIHLIYKYNGRHLSFDGHYVELQIRSLIQHSWATAVEVVGTFTMQALKASEGHDEWLDFFKLASKAFEDIENRKLHTNAHQGYRRELIDLITELNVLPRLRAFTVSTKHLGSNKKIKAEYYLLTLNIAESNIKVQHFTSANFQDASEQYATLEKECKQTRDRDVVLVTADSITALKKAYPNYFADTTDFAKNLMKLMLAHSRYLENQIRILERRHAEITNGKQRSITS